MLTPCETLHLVRSMHRRNFTFCAFTQHTCAFYAP